MAPGTYTVLRSERAGGFRRSFRLHVPDSYRSGRPHPLVVAVHGAFSSAEQFERRSGFSTLADSEGFVVVYPNGYGFFDWFRHWNSGHCCGPALASQTDDVEFLAGVIEQVAGQLSIDRRRVYLVGHSNGGMLVHRFAAERSDLVAAAAAVSATIGGRPGAGEEVWRIPPPLEPVPIALFHGLRDERIPFGGGVDEGGGGRTWLSVDEAVAFWVEHNGSLPPGAAATLDAGRVTRATWAGEGTGSAVELYAVRDGGHDWPAVGEPDAPKLAEMIWSFFERQSPPAAPERQRDDGGGRDDA